MEKQIRDRRRIELSLWEYCEPKAEKDEKKFIGKYLYYVADGCLKTIQGTSLEDMPGLQLSSICSRQPQVSGVGKEDILWHGKRFFAVIRRYIDMNLGEMADLQAFAYPAYEAVSDSCRHCRLTYMDLKEYSDSLAKSFLKIGVEKGDHIAVIMDNCWENVVTKIAVEKTGGVIINLNIHEKAAMLRKLLYQTDVKVIVLRQGIKNREHMELLYEICPELHTCRPGQIACGALPKLKHLVVTDQGRSVSCAWQFEELLDGGRSLDDEPLKERMESVTAFDDATIIHTSGTSGEPKSILLAHGQVLENAWSHVRCMELNSDDRLCMTAPMFHSLGSIGCVVTTQMAGGTLICADRLGGEELLEVIQKERCTVFCSVPTVFIRLIELVRERGAEKERTALRLCVTAGAPCPKQTLEDMRQVLGASQVITMYGMTEAGPGISSTALNDPPGIVTSTVGRLWPGVECRILNLETGKESDPEEEGEICIKSYGIMKRYYNNPEGTRKAIDKEGWLHTGDVGILRRDGCLILRGRCKDLIIRGGENISPKEVEEFLLSHEAVMEAAVVGVPDMQYGEKIFAYVRLRAGKKLEGKELIQWCRGKIATIKIPEEIIFVDALPVSDTGKTAKALLRQWAVEREKDKERMVLDHGKDDIDTGSSRDDTGWCSDRFCSAGNDRMAGGNRAGY